jgi:type IV pilus assembly protein PilO
MALADVVEQINDFDINDIDFDRIGVWPLVGRLAVCVLAVVIIWALTYFMLVKDLNINLDRVVAKEAELRRSFELKSFEAANLDAYRAQKEEMKKSLAALVSQLPSDTEVPGLLEDIDERGAESGLDINSIKLQPERAKEFYIELPIDIDMVGGYHDMGSFVSGIAAMPRIVTLHDYDIKMNKGDSLLAIKIKAKTYRYKLQDEG